VARMELSLYVILHEHIIPKTSGIAGRVTQRIGSGSVTIEPIVPSSHASVVRQRSVSSFAARQQRAWLYRRTWSKPSSRRKAKPRRAVYFAGFRIPDLAR
jgi:hypothetical protein